MKKEGAVCDLVADLCILPNGGDINNSFTINQCVSVSWPVGLDPVDVLFSFSGLMYGEICKAYASFEGVTCDYHI